MSTCQFGRYRFIRQQFGLAPVGNIFQQKVHVIFKDLHNIFGTAHDIVILGYDADDRDHDKTLTHAHMPVRKLNT